MCADNPEDFNFFFDTSRRRVCNIAPERFLASSTTAASQVRQAAGEMVIQGSAAPDSSGGGVVGGNLNRLSPGGFESLEPSMDIFSAGCVIGELFTEGNPLFDYAELLAFSVNQHNPDTVIDKIEDPDIRDLVRIRLPGYQGFGTRKTPGISGIWCV